MNLTQEEKQLLQEAIELIRYKVILRTKPNSAERNGTLYNLQDNAEHYADHCNGKEFDKIDLSKTNTLKKLLTTESRGLRELVKDELKKRGEDESN